MKKVPLFCYDDDSKQLNMRIMIIGNDDDNFLVILNMALSMLRFAISTESVHMHFLLFVTLSLCNQNALANV